MLGLCEHTLTYGGSAADDGGRIRLTIEPSGGRLCFGAKPEKHSCGSWSCGNSLVNFRSRTIAILSAITASRRMSSQMSMPGTLVAIGWNSLRYSTGERGFLSNVSTWLGPPIR